MSDARALEETLSRFADRLFRTGGDDPGAAAVDVPEERFAIYRDLVGNNYEVMLRFALTQSCKLLTHLIEERGAELGLPAAFDDLVLRFLEVSPATTHSTREICRRFHAFLPGAYPDLFAARPELTHLIELERAEAHAYYNEDDPGRAPSADDLAGFAGGSVDAFLAVEVLRAPSSSHFLYPRAVSELYVALRRGAFPAAANDTPESVTVTRMPRTLLPSIRAQPASAGNVFAQLERGGAARVEALAERWIEDLPAALAGVSDAERFGAFGGAVLGGLENGFFRLA